MTAIAVFQIDTVPVIVGDVLFSTEGEDGYSIILPGSGDKSDELAHRRRFNCHPAELKQKVTVINDNLIVACSGPQDKAVDLINYLLEDEILNTNPTYDHLKEILDIFECVDDNNYGYVYIYIDEEVCVTAGGGASRAVEVPSCEGLEGLVVSGSGSDAIVEALTNIEFTFNDDNVSDGRKAAFKVNQLLTRLWTLDITNQKSIEEGFGGGYEIGTIDENKVTMKIGDILFIDIEAQTHPEGYCLGVNSRFTKTDYQDGNFIVRVMQMGKKDGAGKALASYDESDLYVSNMQLRGTIIPPITMDFTDLVIDTDKLETLPDFNAGYSNVHLRVIADNGRHLSLVFSEIRPLRNGPVEFKNNEVFFTPALWRSINEKAREFLANNPSESTPENEHY